MNNSDSPEGAMSLIEGGGDMAGAAVGGALGLIGGPAGIAAGAVGGVLVTRTVKRIGNELSERFLSPRQRLRTGAAFAVAADDIHARLEAGDEPRDDGFFVSRDDHRSSAEELLEGTLLQAADSYEERKVTYLGHFYSSVIFDESVSAGEANFLLRIAESITYRQLVFLSIIGRGDWNTKLIDIDVDRSEGTINSWPETGHEITELGSIDLIGIVSPGGVARPMSEKPGAGIMVSGLGRAALRPLGLNLFRLMRLDVYKRQLHGRSRMRGLDRRWFE